MKIGPLFWVLFILMVLAWLGAFWWPPAHHGFPVFVLVELGLLGWSEFGAAIQKGP